MAETPPYPRRLIWLGRVTIVIGILDLLRSCFQLVSRRADPSPTIPIHAALVTSMAVVGIVSGTGLVRGRRWSTALSILAWGAMGTLVGIYSWQILPSFVEQIAARNFGDYFEVMLPHVLCWVPVLLISPYAWWALFSAAEEFRPRRRILLGFLALGVAWGAGSYAVIVLVGRAANKLIFD